MDNSAQIVFENECRMARNNKISLIGGDTDVIINNNANATLLGNSIAGNKKTTAMDIMVMQGLAVEGANALAYGLVRSNVETLTVRQHYTLRLPAQVLKLILDAAVETARNFDLKYLLDETDAINLGQALRGENLVVVRHLALHLGNVTSKGAQAVAAGIRESNIVKLTFCGCATPVSALSSLNEVMRTIYLQGVKRSASLRELSLNHRIGDMNDLLCVVPNLKALDINHVQMSASSLQLLVGRLRRDSNLEMLALESCSLGVKCVQILAQGLRRNRTLKALSLKDNRWIGDAGISAFVENWSHESSVVSLKFGNTGMTVTGAVQLLQASKTRNWKNLCIQENEAIGTQGIEMIVRELADTKLEKFIVRNSATLQWASDRNRRKALVDVLQTNSYLWDTDLDCCVMPTSLRDIIKFYLRLNKHGRFLLAEEEDLLPTVWCHVLAKCRDKRPVQGKKYGPSCMYYLLQQQPALMLAAATKATCASPKRTRSASRTPCTRSKSKRRRTA